MDGWMDGWMDGNLRGTQRIVNAVQLSRDFSSSSKLGPCTIFKCHNPVGVRLAFKSWFCLQIEILLSQKFQNIKCYAALHNLLWA